MPFVIATWSTPNNSRTTGTLITAAIWNQDVGDNPIALRAGAIAIATQAANDLIYATSSTQLGRLAAGASNTMVLVTATAAGAPSWLAPITAPYGGTGVATFTAANRIPYAASATALATSAGLVFDGTTLTANALALTTVLSGAYGGTGINTFTAAGRIPYAASATALTTSAGLTYDGSTTLSVVSGGGSTQVFQDGSSGQLIVIAGNLYLTIDSGRKLLCTQAYNMTDPGAANLVIQSDGFIGRSTSSRRYKRNFQPFDDWRWLMDLTVESFNSQNNPDGRRYAGLTAEDVAAKGPTDHLGIPLFCALNAAGEPDEVFYNYLTAPLILGLSDHERRIAVLERRP